MTSSTNTEFPWAVVRVDGDMGQYPGVPAFKTRVEAEDFVEARQSEHAKWPIDGGISLEWRPDLNENPNAIRVSELLEEADVVDHPEALEALQRAQVYATLCVRDALAGFGLTGAAVPVALVPVEAPSSAEVPEGVSV